MNDIEKRFNSIDRQLRELHIQIDRIDKRGKGGEGCLTWIIFITLLSILEKIN